MIAFVTVGSTHFDSLVDGVLSTPVLGALRSRRFSKLVIQCGKTKLQANRLSQPALEGLEIEIWDFKDSLDIYYEQADLVISHAGSGTILEVLRRGIPLIVVPNPKLLDNHQGELAQALQSLGHLKATTVQNLAVTIDALDSSKLVPFPPFEGSKFRDFLDKEMGFI